MRRNETVDLEQQFIGNEIHYHSYLCANVRQMDMGNNRGVHCQNLGFFAVFQCTAIFGGEIFISRSVFS